MDSLTFLFCNFPLEAKVYSLMHTNIKQMLTYKAISTLLNFSLLEKGHHKVMLIDLTSMSWCLVKILDKHILN